MENHDFIKRWLTFPGGLATRLQAMRQSAGVRAADLARDFGWGRSKVTKIEKGDQFPTESDIRAWGTACSADQDTIERLIAQRNQSWQLHLAYRARAGDASPPMQALYTQLMETSQTVTLIETLVVPGPLQVADYARAVLTMAHVRNNLPLDHLDQEVNERLDRARFIGAPGLDLGFLVHEAALTITVGSPATMLAQLDRLQTVIDHPKVRFGVIPFSVPLTEMPRAFGIYDDLVIAETMTGDITHAGDNQAHRYRQVADRLWNMAAESSNARSLILTAAQRHRDNLQR